jgi:hypothetical protein
MHEPTCIIEDITELPDPSTSDQEAGSSSASGSPRLPNADACAAPAAAAASAAPAHKPGFEPAAAAAAASPQQDERQDDDQATEQQQAPAEAAEEQEAAEASVPPGSSNEQQQDGGDQQQQQQEGDQPAQEPWVPTTDEETRQVEGAEALKQQGNELYGQERYDEAMAKYQEVRRADGCPCASMSAASHAAAAAAGHDNVAVCVLGSTTHTHMHSSYAHTRRPQALDAAPPLAAQRAVYYANLAACCLKLGQPRLAAEHCSCALRVDGRWVAVGVGDSFLGSGCGQVVEARGAAGGWGGWGWFRGFVGAASKTPVFLHPPNHLNPIASHPRSHPPPATSRRSCAARRLSRRWRTPTTRWPTRKR